MGDGTMQITRPWRHEGTRGGLALTTLCLAQFVAVLNFQGAAIGLPEIQRSLAMPASTGQWVISANALVFGALLLCGGRAADLFGHRRIFGIGLAIFAIASLAASFAPSAGWLIAARAAEGAGTALYTPAALALLSRSFPEGSERNRALAIWGAAGPLGGIASVIIGGALADALGWRSIFVLAVPLALAPLAISRMVFPERGGEDTGQLNLGNVLAGTGGIALFVFGLSEISRTGPSMVGLVVVCIGGALLGALVAGERRAEAPLVPPALFEPRLLGAVAVSFLHGAATNTPIVFFVLFLTQVWGATPLEMGLSFLPCNVAVIAGSALGARLVEWRGVAAAMAAGMAVVVSGLLALTAMAVDGTYARTLLPGLVLWGLGLGLAQVGIVGTAAAEAEPAERGIAAGLVSTAAKLGTAVGVTLLVAVATRFGGAEPEQMVAGYRAAFVGGAALALLGLVAALLGPRAQVAGAVTRSAAGETSGVASGQVGLRSGRRQIGT